MKKLIAFGLSLFILSCSLFAQQINDPNVIKVDAKDFHGINVSSAFDVYLTQGNEESVAVSASEEKFRDKIKVEVKDGILRIRYDNNGFHWNSGKMKLKAYISFKQLDKLTVSGACDVFAIGNIKVEDLDVNLSGASDLKTVAKDGMKEGTIEAKKLDVNVSGASDIKVSGSVAQLKVDASGASDFKGYDLVTDYCDAKATGASSVQITVNKELSANASGASDVHYKGDAVIRDLRSSGASNVSKRS